MTAPLNIPAGKPASISSGNVIDAVHPAQLTWNDCVINAEDCRIKAVRQPHHRDDFLKMARWWDGIAEQLDG